MGTNISDVVWHLRFLALASGPGGSIHTPQLRPWSFLCLGDVERGLGFSHCCAIAQEIQDAKAKGVLFSLHLKATMMKVSDPIMFGHCVEVYYKDVFEKHAATFKKLLVDPNNGVGDVYTKIEQLPEAERNAIEADLKVWQSFISRRNLDL